MATQTNKPYNNPHSAKQHSSLALHATDDAAIAAGILYKAVYFNVAGSLDVVDAAGTLETVTGAIGTVYPVQNYGAVTGGGTTLTEGQFLLLRDG